MRVSFVIVAVALGCGGTSAPKVDAARDSPSARDTAAIPVDTAGGPEVAGDTHVVDSQPPRDTAPPDTRGNPADTGKPDSLGSIPDTQVPKDTPGDLAALPDLARPVDAPEDPQARDAVSRDTTVIPGDAPSTKPITFSAWPGDNKVANASVNKAFGTNVSGLVYEPAAGAATAILWAVQNNPSTVYRLTWNGTAFVSVANDGWGAGKTLTYPTGSGTPDSEALTRTEWDKTELYVAAEESNAATSTSRLSILRYDLAGTATTLKATHEWNLTADLPAMDPNKGLEAIAWIPDTYLVERGFYDENTKATYNPATYANHGTGIFLVGAEAMGMIYGYAVDHGASTYKRVATFNSGQAGTMDLAFDRETGTLWAICDSVCDNRMTLFDIDTTAGSATKGRFSVRATVPPPTTLTSTNNEGITMAPEGECANNRKGFFWADDDESKGYAIRRDTIPCGRLF